LGRPEDGTDPSLANNLEIFVKLKPMDVWPKVTPNLESLIVAMNREVIRTVGIEVNFSQPIRDNVNDNISGQPGQIALKIYSNDLRQLQSAAEKAKGYSMLCCDCRKADAVPSRTSPTCGSRPRQAHSSRWARLPM